MYIYHNIYKNSRLYDTFSISRPSCALPSPSSLPLQHEPDQTPSSRPLRSLYLTKGYNHPAFPTRDAVPRGVNCREFMPPHLPPASIPMSPNFSMVVISLLRRKYATAAPLAGQARPLDSFFLRNFCSYSQSSGSIVFKTLGTCVSIFHLLVVPTLGK